MLQTVLTVSGKGGVGKTLLNAHLAFALSRHGQRVLLAEMTPGFRSLDLLLGLDGLVYDFADLFSGQCSPNDALLRPQDAAFSLLAAPPDPGWTPAPAVLDAFLQWADAHYDFLLLDTPAGYLPLHKTLAPRGTLALVTAAPEPLSVRAAAEISAWLRADGCTNQRLVIDRVPPSLPAGPIRDLDDVIDRTGIQLIAAVPEEPALPRFGAFVSSPAREELNRLARRLLGESPELVLF